MPALVRRLAAFALVVGAAAVPADAAETASHAIATDAGPLVIHPIEHATLVVEWDGRTIFVDPVGGAERFAAFPTPDLILITHIHGDHMSAETLEGVSTADTPLVMPASVDEQLGEAVPGRRIVLANGESAELGGVAIDAIPAYNTTEERLAFHPEGRDNGYVLTVGGRRVYVSGDTEDIPEMRALENIDAALVCMNLPYTMDVEQAASAVLEFKPREVLPYHSRGKDGMSDLARFRELVAADPSITVTVLDWYGDSGSES